MSGGGGRKCVRYELIDRQDTKVTDKTEVKEEKPDQILKNKTRNLHFEQILL